MNIFKDGFVEPNVNFPEKLTLEIINGFSNATQGLAQLKLMKLENFQGIQLSSLNNIFQFKVVLTSDYLNGYSFKVFDFGYDVSIYPVYIKHGDAIGEELKIERDFVGSYISYCNSEDKFIAVLNAIFASNNFKKTVGGLMKIAKSRMQNT
jgi:hypothetical protein